MPESRSSGNAYQGYIRKKLLVIVVLIAVMIGTGLVGLSIGGSSYSIGQSWEAIWTGLWLAGSGDMDTAQQIVWSLRVPRVLTAVICGFGLAFAGLIMQTILRNPLASPFTLGVSAAASFGAAVAIVLKSGITALIGLTLHYDWLVIANAFIFAFLCTLFIYALSKLQNTTPETIVLLGVAMMFMFSAATSFLQYLGDPDELAELVYWMFGSLSKATWGKLQIMLITVLVTLFVTYRKSWDFNALLLGDESAKSTGIDAEKLRLTGLILASLTTAVIISMVGPIGFIGLVAPHLGRILIGGDHRFLIPASCLIGATLLLAADAAARTILAPVVIPVGIITSFVGVPLLIYLMMRRRKEHW